MPRHRHDDRDWHDICDSCGQELDEGVLLIVGGKVVKVTCGSCRDEALIDQAR